MIDLLIRRMEMGTPPAPEPLPEYVSDGLVFWLDGKVKGNTAGAWTDLIGGLVFVPKSDGVTFNSDNVQFNGTTNKCLYTNQSTSPCPNNGNYNDGTIEACYRDLNGSSGKEIFYSPNGIYFRLIGSNRVAMGGKNNKNGNWSSGATGTYSVSRERVYQNFVSKGLNSNTTWSGTNAQVCIVGGAGHSSATSFDSVINGKIHSIRIYNRKLTAEEMLYNQAIDNTRFNLGLTVNS